MLTRFSSSLVVAPFVLALLACGGSDSETAGSGGASGSGGSGGAPFVSAPHAPMVMKDHGGGVFAKPGLVTITFSTFDKTDYVQQFGDSIVDSDYFTTAMKEYGVGAGVHLAKAVLTDNPPLTDKTLNALLQQRMANGTLPSPADNPEAVYVVYFPKHTKFDDQGPLCGAFDGYHSWDDFQGHRYVYAIIGECDGMINTASHELAEAATDPYNGWYLDGPKDDPYFWVTDDELADLCEYFPSVTVDGYPVTRLYSNEAAKANQDPCLPLPPKGEIFENVEAMPATLQTVDRGKETTFMLTGWSTAATKPWPLIMDHATYYPNYKGAFKATAKLSKTTIQNGETISLTVGVPSDAKPGQLGMIGIYSDKLYAEECFVGVIAQ